MTTNHKSSVYTFVGGKFPTGTSRDTEPWKVLPERLNTHQSEDYWTKDF